jgi:uncharacterized protein YaaQ
MNGVDQHHPKENQVKLVVAIVLDRDAGNAIGELTRNGYGVTRINTYGGFLKRGNATLLAGVEDAETGNVIEILRRACGTPEFSSEGIRANGVAFVLPVIASVKM